MALSVDNQNVNSSVAAAKAHERARIQDGTAAIKKAETKRAKKKGTNHVPYTPTPKAANKSKNVNNAAVVEDIEKVLRKAGEAKAKEAAKLLEDLAEQYMQKAGVSQKAVSVILRAATQARQAVFENKQVTGYNGSPWMQDIRNIFMVIFQAMKENMKTNSLQELANADNMNSQQHMFQNYAKIMQDTINNTQNKLNKAHSEESGNVCKQIAIAIGCALVSLIPGVGEVADGAAIAADVADTAAEAAEAADSVAGSLSDVASTVGDAADTAGESLSEGLNSLSSQVDEASEGVKEAANEAKSAIQKAVKAAADKSEDAGELANKAKAALSKLEEASSELQGVLKNAATYVSDNADTIGEEAGSLSDKIGEATTAAENLGSKIGTMTESLDSAVNDASKMGKIAKLRHMIGANKWKILAGTLLAGAGAATGGELMYKQACMMEGNTMAQDALDTESNTEQLYNNLVAELQTQVKQDSQYVQTATTQGQSDSSISTQAAQMEVNSFNISLS